MTPYLFIVNAEEYDASTVDKKGGSWSCSKDTTVGDRVFVYVTAEGIKYEWAVMAPAAEDRKWKYKCRVRRKREFVPPIDIKKIRASIPREVWAAPYTNFRGFRSIRIPDDALKSILALRPSGTTFDHEEGQRVGHVELDFLEGEKRATKTTVRNAKLRDAAKKHWGLKCCCCGFDFAEFYGSFAAGSAIVHHLELFTNGQRRQSTVDDVRVVCPNCHYVIHLTDPPMDVDHLKRLISKSWNPWSATGVTRKRKKSG